MSDSNIFEYIKNINKKSKEAFDVISRSSSKDRNLAILNTSKIIKKEQKEILKANKIDIENAKKKKLNNAFIDRLFLDNKRIDNIVEGLKQISEMNDPIGVELSKWTQPNGLNISKISVIEKKVSEAYASASTLLKSEKEKIITKIKEIYSEADEHNDKSKEIFDKLIKLLK